YRFSAVVSQRDAASIYSGGRRYAEVKLAGQADHELQIIHEQILPANQQMLPSAALGWLGGGQVEVAQEDSSGRRAAAPFFEVRATVANDPAVLLRHGLSGYLRHTLEPEPLLRQWGRKLRQLL